MRFRTNRRRDHAFFRHTANKTAAANIAGRLVPRGGIRL